MCRRTAVRPDNPFQQGHVAHLRFVDATNQRCAKMVTAKLTLRRPGEQMRFGLQSSIPKSIQQKAGNK
jgi:hypothetical protein